jgi:guanine deaminase
MTEPNDMDSPFMARAIQLSIENVRSGRGGPFGCVIVKEAKVIAEAVNQVTATNDPTAHSEVLAIRQACQKLRCFELRDCDLYTSCQPCPMCLAAIYWARIGKVYFGNLAADAAKVGFDDSAIFSAIYGKLSRGELAQSHGLREIPMIQMMREEALAAFRAWEESPGKILY